MSRKLFINANWIITPEKVSHDMKKYHLVTFDGDSILVEDGKIVKIGNYKEFDINDELEVIDLEGRGVTPGLIDFHTHPVFAATREEEFELRTKGATYTEIAAAGGGILNSVKKLRSLDSLTLKKQATKYLDNALSFGTTTMEAKSGYGLNPEAEYRMLEVINSLDEDHTVDLIPTFLGAHEVPAEYKNNREEYIRIIIEEMIPHVAKNELAKACDIFCETGVYDLDETRKILSAAKKAGLGIKVHADQLTPLGGTKLAVELEALSADHIEFIDDEALELLKDSNTVAGLLPVAAHFLRMQEDPPVRKMVDMGITCALATDFNPGSAMCESMQMAIHLAVIRFRVIAEEAFWMATAGSALALGLNDRGWLGEGAKADMIAWDTNSIKQIPYHFGINNAGLVIKNGEVVVRNS